MDAALYNCSMTMTRASRCGQTILPIETTTPALFRRSGWSPSTPPIRIAAWAHPGGSTWTGVRQTPGMSSTARVRPWRCCARSGDDAFQSPCFPQRIRRFPRLDLDDFHRADALSPAEPVEPVEVIVKETCFRSLTHASDDAEPDLHHRTGPFRRVSPCFRAATFFPAGRTLSLPGGRCGR